MAAANSAQILRFGEPLNGAAGAVLLLHGRGSSAEDIAGLSRALSGEGFAFVAPSAPAGTWYPQRFLVPTALNEPWLSDALALIDRIVAELETAGLGAERLGLAGFSQGACLSLEYAYRRPRSYGFVAALSGALIGPLETERPPVPLKSVPVLLGCAEMDAHIPVEFVHRTAATFEAAGASVTKRIFPGGAHTVFPPEIEWMNAQLGAMRARHRS